MEEKKDILVENNIEEKKEQDPERRFLEKIGVLEKKVESEKEEKKSLNQRIEDLVIQIEKVNKVVKKEFSFKRIFLRGLLQGLGIVIGSTILAGVLYSVSVKFVDKKVIQKYTLEHILDEEQKKNTK